MQNSRSSIQNDSLCGVQLIQEIGKLIPRTRANIQLAQSQYNKTCGSSHSQSSSSDILQELTKCLLQAQISSLFVDIMSTLVNITRLGLLLLCVAGYYSTWHILLNNGTTKFMSQIRDVGPRVLPGTTEPLKTVYVGIQAIDYQLTILTLFFWELVNGSNPTASLFCFHFATQVACGWGLLMIEGLRRGHRWRVISL